MGAFNFVNKKIKDISCIIKFCQFWLNLQNLQNVIATKFNTFKVSLQSFVGFIYFYLIFDTNGYCSLLWEGFGQFFCCIRCNLSWMCNLMSVLLSADSRVKSDPIFSDYKATVTVSCPANIYLFKFKNKNNDKKKKHMKRV